LLFGANGTPNVSSALQNFLNNQRHLFQTRSSKLPPLLQGLTRKPTVYAGVFPIPDCIAVRIVIYPVDTARGRAKLRLHPVRELAGNERVAAPERRLKETRARGAFN
jgi:hypothetical protein